MPLFLKRPLEVLDIVARGSANVSQQRVRSLVGRESGQWLGLDRVDAEPFWAIYVPAFKHVEEAAELGRALHMVREQGKVSLMRELPVTF